MKITLDFLREKNACEDGFEKFKSVFKDDADLKKVVKYAIDKNKKVLLQYCNWLITKVMTKDQCVEYAIFAAELVLKFYENKYNDDIPRKAIEAAKKYLKLKTKKSADAAHAAHAAHAAAAYAADAADAAYAADAAAAYAADAAAYAADAAADAADAAADAADAAYAAAAHAAHAAYAADAYKYNLMLIKILKHGIKIIYRKEK